MAQPEPASRPPATPKPAATMVLLRDRGPGPCRPEVLLLERHGASTVGAGAYVFPGGMVEPDDLAPAAARLAPGLSPEQAQARLGGGVSPAEALGYFVAAIRETFEEALVLLAGPAGIPPRPALEAARARLLAGELTFVDWIAAQGLALQPERLVYFAHWITPEVVPQRFSARFFVAAAPVQAEPLADGQEVLRHRWLEPAEAIALRRQGDIHLMDPTVRNLELLGSFGSTGEALRELNRREVRAILPKLRYDKDGTRRVTYPWDPQYDRA